MIYFKSCKREFFDDINDALNGIDPEKEIIFKL